MQVLTATEFFTSSSILTPSIIQTLNVEVTLTETSTKGLNGHFTLAQVTPGASKIIEQPISSTNIDFDTQGLDLSSIDLATLDLAGLRGSGNGDNAQVVKALTALLKQYNDEPEETRGPERGRGRERDRDQRNFGNTRFHTRSRFSPESEDPPKFNVIRGFTLSDRPSSRNTDSSSGTAIENTRYSKFRKKSNVQNNSLGSTEPDRESERFSASTSRRTVSRAGERRRDTRGENRPQGRSRFPSNSQFSSRSSQGETDRQAERSRRGSDKDIKLHVTPEMNEIRISNDKLTSFTTTLLTMHISGVRPGEIITTVRTVTLRGLQSARSKREIYPNPLLPLPQPITNTAIPDLTSTLQSKEVVRLLKDLDKTAVRKMLHSLHDWVNYYLHQVLDETIEPSFNSYRGLATNEITDLHSSKREEESASAQDATASLQSLPNAITRNPSVVASVINSCPTVSVTTETVYKTIIVSKPR